MPSASSFVGTKTQTALESFYATEFHELGHLSGAPMRLNRDFGKKFGDVAYTYEELVAEITSAFLCAKLGITDAPHPDHAQYLNVFLKLLKDNSNAIVTAASKASQAVEYLSTMREMHIDLSKTANDNPPPAMDKKGQFKLFG